MAFLGGFFVGCWVFASGKDSISKWVPKNQVWKILEVVSETTPLIGVKLPQLSIYFRPFVGVIYIYI